MQASTLDNLDIENDPIGALQACLDVMEARQASSDYGSDDPNSPNYKYKDTGYISGSRKEMAAQMITEARKNGTRLRATDIDFTVIEQNPRLAAELITKNNLFGKTDWAKLQESGMEPAAGFLLDKVYGSIGSEPTNALPESTLRKVSADYTQMGILASVDRTSDSALARTRKDYARGLETIRDRLESKKTVDEIMGVLSEIKSELFGVQLNADQADLLTKLNEQYQEKRAIVAKAKAEKEAVFDAWYSPSTALTRLGYERDSRTRKKWKPDPELEAKYAELSTKVEALNKTYQDYLKAHPELASESREFTIGDRHFTVRSNALEFEAHKIRKAIELIENAARMDNLLNNPVTRSWLSLGERFLKLLNYRGSGGSDAFAGHVTNARAGKVKDWSWSDKERATQPKTATKQEVGFQLRVVDTFNRKGGKKIVAHSTKDLENMLGLRAVQSGNWVLKDPNSAKFHIEQTVNAMSDMSDILGIDVEGIGFGGRLSMAFGARGVGGKNAAAAHYEPVERVINLTKMKGGGSIGHEWFHAMDNMMPEMLTGVSGAKDNFMTADPDLIPAGNLREAMRALKKAMFDGDQRPAETIKYTGADIENAKHNTKDRGYGMTAPAKLIVNAGDAAKAVIAIREYFGGRTDRKAVKRLKDWVTVAAAYYHQGELAKAEEAKVSLKTGAPTSNFAVGAYQLDGGATGKYWSQHEEMAARAFQAYLEDTLAKNDRQNDYLSAYADNKYHIDPLFGIEWKPYPEGDERVRINAAFDGLFRVIKDEEVFKKALSNKALMDSIFGFDSVDFDTLDVENDPVGVLEQLLTVVEDRNLSASLSFPFDEVDRGWYHSTRNSEGVARSMEQQYLSAINAAKEKAEPEVKTPEQQTAFNEGLRELQQLYIRKVKSLASVRQGVTSSFIAGRSNFNSKQSAQRGNAFDKAALAFEDWVSNVVPTFIWLKVRQAMSSEQRADELEATTTQAKAKAQAKLEKDASVLWGILEPKVFPMDYSKGFLITKVNFDKEKKPSSINIAAKDGSFLINNKIKLSEIFKDMDSVLSYLKDQGKNIPTSWAEVNVKGGTQDVAGEAAQAPIISSVTIEGRTNTVKTAKGTKLDTVFALVEADKLIASHTSSGAENKAYPQELQPRDRGRESSQAWVQKVAASLDPESLGRTGRADSGAPIVGDDLVVESGNGRTMAIKLAYERGTADEYREWLQEEAEYFGFKAGVVEGMKEPILVRIRKTPIDRAVFAVEANQDDKLSFTATERAKSDAKRIDGNLAQLFNPSEDGDLLSAGNQKFIQGFLRSLGDTESAQYIAKDGKPTQALVARIKAAVFSKAYNDDRLLEMVADQTKPDLQNMLNALSVAAPKFIEAQSVDKANVEDASSKIVDGIEQAVDKKVINAIIDAANTVMQAKSNNQDVAEFVKQQGLFGDLPEGVPELAVFLAQNSRSAKKMSLLFKAMASYLEKRAIEDQNGGLFGDPEPITIKEVMAHAASVVEQSYGENANLSMFDGAAIEPDSDLAGVVLHGFDAITDGQGKFEVHSVAPELVDDEHQALFNVVRDDGVLLAPFTTFADATLVCDLLNSRGAALQLKFNSWMADGSFDHVPVQPIELHLYAKEAKERTPTVKTPVLLQHTNNGRYMLIAGVKRLALAHKIGDDYVPAIVLPVREGYTNKIIRKAFLAYTGSIDPIIMAADIEQICENEPIHGMDAVIVMEPETV